MNIIKIIYIRQKGRNVMNSSDSFKNKPVKEKLKNVFYHVNIWYLVLAIAALVIAFMKHQYIGAVIGVVIRIIGIV